MDAPTTDRRRGRRHRPGRCLAVLLLTTGLLVPTGALAQDRPAPKDRPAAAPQGSAPTVARHGADGATVRAAAREPAEVRDLSYACPEAHVSRAGFDDVPDGSTFARAIDCLVGFGITRGRTPDRYAPNAAVTRQQMAVFLHRMLDDLLVLPAVPAGPRFDDVDATGEAGRAIGVLASDELAVALGIRIVSGRTATSFEPAAPVTRAQMASFIARTFEAVFEAKGYEIVDRGECSGVFSDEDAIPAAHAPSVALLCAGGVVTGRRDGTYGPHEDVTRGQMAAFLMRLMDLYVEGTVARPAHHRSELVVDRGTGEAPCSSAGRDGTRSSPLCSIQDAVTTAEQRRWDDHAVTITVVGRPDQPAYAEDVVIDRAAVHAYDIVGEAAAGGRVPLEGRVTVGESGPGYVTVGRLEVTAPTAVRIEAWGFTALVDVATRGTRGVVLDQPSSGTNHVSSSDLRASSLAVDAIRTGYLVARGTRFRDAPEAYVALPAGATADEADTIFAASFLDPALGNTFAHPPVRATLGDGRRGLVPSR